MPGIVDRLLGKYQDDNHVTKLKARFLLQVCIAAIFVIPLIIAYNVYLCLTKEVYGYAIYWPIIAPLIIIYIIYVFTVLLVFWGRFSLGAHMFFIASQCLMWSIIFIDKSGPLERMDTIVVLIAILSMSPLIIRKHALFIPFYSAVTILTTFVFVLLFWADLNLTRSQAVDFLGDTAIASIVVAIMTYNLFSINRAALTRTEESMRALMAMNKEIAATNAELSATMKALKESEEINTILVKTIPDIIVRTDLEGNVLFVNENALSTSGYRREDIVGQSLLTFIASEDQELAVKNMHLIGSNRMALRAYYFVRKNGMKVPYEVNAGVLSDEDKGAFGYVFICRDITERKQAEDEIKKSAERYRAIFDGTGTANIIVAEDTTILRANDRFAMLVGYSKEELEGRMSWTMFVASEDLEMVKDNQMRRRLDPASAPSSYEIHAKNRKGEVLNLMLSVALIPETRVSVASLIDLTEKKRLETQLIQSQKMESIGRLAGGVAHDFNNMLSVIVGNTELAIAQVEPTQPIYKNLQGILNAGERSADLTRQLLAFARKQTVLPKILDLNNTVPGMLKMLQRLIGEDIDLGWYPGRKLWEIRIDPSQIDQLLANLTVNARDAIEKAGRIIIETSNEICDEAYCLDRPECLPGEYVMLAVSDNGCGMDRQTLANIFEPFFTTKKEGHGTGLGLATVYGIVKQNGGFINVYSEPGKGTTFRVYLPRYKTERVVTADETEEIQVLGGTETVMIVEDEAAVLDFSKSMLEKLGYRVLATGKADEAIQLAHGYGYKIDLLLTDVIMPGMDGKALWERIKSIAPDLKCLFMSGYTADVIARQGILEEGVHFIPKPFSLRVLALKVREALES